VIALRSRRSRSAILSSGTPGVGSARTRSVACAPSTAAAGAVGREPRHVPGSVPQERLRIADDVRVHHHAGFAGRHSLARLGLHDFRDDEIARDVERRRLAAAATQEKQFGHPIAVSPEDAPSVDERLARRWHCGTRLADGDDGRAGSLLS
jgi:hypothetical protein